MSVTPLDQRRLRNYPRLILIALWTGLLIHVLFHEGWRGGLGQLIGTDFVTFYTGGLLYQANAAQLYDFAAQLEIERRLLYPTPMPGSGPFSNPPFAAMLFAGLGHIPLLPAFLLWTLLQVLCAGVAVAVAWRRLAPAWLRESGMGRAQLAVLLFSTYPLIEGLTAGQMFGMTLLLMTVLCAAAVSESQALAGLAAGLLLYKPQLPLGFLIIWLIGRKWRSLLTFAAVAAIWAGIPLAAKGAEIYVAYIGATRQLLALSYVAGWPRGLMVTPYGLLATLLPLSGRGVAEVAAASVGLLCVLALGWAALRTATRNASVTAMAVLFPLVATPYVLLHDLLILAPALLLLAREASERDALLRVTAIAYLGSLVLPLASVSSGIALAATIPLTLAAYAWGINRRSQAIAPGVISQT